MSALGRRRPPTSRSGHDAGLHRIPNRCAFLKRVGRTELWQALLGQGRSCCGSSGRFDVLAWISVHPRREDVVWNGGDTVPCSVFAFFSEVCPGVSTGVVMVGKRRLTSCGLTLVVCPVVGTVESRAALQTLLPDRLAVFLRALLCVQASEKPPLAWSAPLSFIVEGGETTIGMFGASGEREATRERWLGGSRRTTSSSSLLPRLAGSGQRHLRRRAEEAAIAVVQGDGGEQGSSAQRRRQRLPPTATTGKAATAVGSRGAMRSGGGAIFLLRLQRWEATVAAAATAVWGAGDSSG
ncbi:hypothetical protein Taro_051133 [Colocasia esculenta]|uniref:Uncharacterized protein n=1 Tax=Colocasia esculenta TaxID=4460 RepID=A0A843XFQ3_COLES|nr:hypothetical protein [Colocasia esculenta]